jgi:hypothetical protein
VPVQLRQRLADENNGFNQSLRVIRFGQRDRIFVLHLLVELHILQAIKSAEKTRAAELILSLSGRRDYVSMRVGVSLCIITDDNGRLIIYTAERCSFLTIFFLREYLRSCYRCSRRA